jgi:iron(III) transport system substrate-binding protein
MSEKSITCAKGSAPLLGTNHAEMISSCLRALTLGAILALSFAAARAGASDDSELLARARAEGQVSFYNAVDIEVAERVKQAFEARYPGIKVNVERSGAQRLFQRLSQEYESGIYNADVVNSSDAAHFVLWARRGWLAAYLPEEVSKYYDKANYDPGGRYATWKASLSVVGYNTKYVKPDQAPKSYADLLDPKWKGMIVKAHPSYSGTILTSTYQIANTLGWDYFQKLAAQKVMQVQSSTDSPKKLAIGERPIMADGTESNMFALKESGAPVEIVYPSEGSPYVPSPTGIMEKAPHPYAARLFQNFLYSVELQKLLVEVGERSLHPLVADKAGRRPLASIKLLAADPAKILEEADEIKARYTHYFGI